MKILVTGGMGFQGTHLVEALAAHGHEVSVLNTPTKQAHENERYIAGKAQIIWGSITDPEIIEKSIRNKDIVFHLGARINVDESIQDPWGTLRVNIEGTHNVLEAVRKSGVRMIHASTCEVYGKPEVVPIKENAELRPHSPYAASKTAADRLAFAYFKTYGVRVTIARPFNVFGERQKEHSFGAVIPIFVGRAMRGEPLKVFGSGLQTRDYIHVDDVVQGYLTILNHPELDGEVVNMGRGVGVSVKTLAERIASEFSATVNYVDARPGEASDMIADSTKMMTLTNWRPQIDFDTGLKRYIEWRKQAV